VFLLDLPTIINSQKIPEVTPFVLIRSSTAAERLLKEASVRTSSEGATEGIYSDGLP
jgi:hypothetical protein